MKFNQVIHWIFRTLLVMFFIKALRATIQENEGKAILFLAWILVIAKIQAFFERFEQAIIRMHRYPRKEGEE